MGVKISRSRRSKDIIENFAYLIKWSSNAVSSIIFMRLEIRPSTSSTILYITPINIYERNIR
jgi:hypothetical protein